MWKEGRFPFPLRFQGSESHRWGNYLCLRCLQKGRWDDIYCPINHQRVTVMAKAWSTQTSWGHCFGKKWLTPVLKVCNPNSVVFMLVTFGRLEGEHFRSSLHSACIKEISFITLSLSRAALYLNKDNFPLQELKGCRTAVLQLGVKSLHLWPIAWHKRQKYSGRSISIQVYWQQTTLFLLTSSFWS